MLSVSSIGSASGAADYYGKDDYYVTGEADAPGLEWGGKGAAKMGLQGKAEGADFKQVLQGTHPAFKDADKAPGGPDGKHRAGWDLTFSAPKSVSLAILVGGDRRLDAAHDKAVDRAMAYAEKHFAITRVRDQGKIREVNTGNLVYAKTVHGTSRTGDPQRHTHVVVANATVEPQTGKVRALETLQLFRHRQLVGRIYQAELAKGAMSLGYDVTRDADRGTIELAGFQRDQLQQFSKRNTEIRASMEIEKQKNGGTLSGAQRDAVALRNRPKKLDVPRSELVTRWHGEAKAAGLDAERVVSTSQARGSDGVDVTSRVSGVVSDGMSRFVAAWKAMTGRAPTLSATDPYSFRPRQLIRDQDARAAVSYGLQVAEQGRAVFTRHEVVGRALDYAVAGMTVDRLEKQLSMLASDGRVQAADARMHGGITTARAIGLEEQLVAQVQAGKGRVAQIMSGPAAAAALSAGVLQGAGGIVLNDGQRQAAEKILSSPDRFVGVQGFAGVGKTTMFQVVRALAEKEGVEIAGLAPTHKAAQELQQGAGIVANTVEKFLAGNERVIERADKGLAKAALTNAQEKWGGKALLVDESSMLSNSQAERLMRVADRLGVGRVIFIGDEKQLGSPEAGAPWRLLLNEGIDHARMTEIRRQKDPEVKTAVEHLAKGAPGPGLRALGSRVVQVGKDASDDKLAGAAFAAWAAVRDSGGNAPVIVPTHSLRDKVSALIRTDLASRGDLGAVAHSVASLSHVRMSRAEAHRAASYKEGQILVLHAGIREAGLSKGAQVTVVGRDERNDRLVVSPDGKRQSTIDLAQLRDSRMSKFETYRAKEIEVRSGDNLVWERRDEDRGFKTGERFTVETISSAGWTIRTNDGKQHQLKADDPALKFTGYAYAETADRSQGSTYQHVVAVLASTHGEGANQARAYVQVSRSADSLTFVTNDVGLLSMRLNRQDGQNMIASHEARDALSAQDASAGRELSAITSALDGASAGPDTLATLKADGLDGSTREPSDLAKATGADGPERDDGSDKLLPGTLEADKPKDSEPAKEAEKDKSFDKVVEVNSPAMGL